jgi:hypothetical protein
MLNRTLPALGCLASLFLTAGGAAELPLREIILYKHGVGFFERSGSIPAGDSARLDFKASEMNDVLKSLIINGKSGSVSGLRYDSGVPLDEKLAAFPFRIDPSQALSGVLDQLKGSRVEMQFGNEKVAGAIVAARLVAGGVAGDKERAERQQVVLLLDSGDMRTVDLDAASGIRFADARLQAQFREYLEALAGARSKEKRSVYIDGNTTGARDITAAYLIPMPIWKSSYRLLFTENGEPVLEGWAIVDNTTDEDWTGVQMALVSGKPISFISELYAPRYIQRAMAELPEEQAMRPELHEGAVAGMVTMSGTNADSNGNFHGMGDHVANSFSSDGGHSVDGSPEYRAQKANRLPPPPAVQMSSIAQGATGIELAELFEYRIAQPVTIKKNESAMLPFLQDKVKARKLDLYSDMSSPHPLNAAELVNSTGKTLDGGPITVYDGGGYAGEALVETVKAGDKRLISYGVDLGVRITNKLDSQAREEREIHVKRGVMTVRVALVRKTTYSINNVDGKAKTLIVEHPLSEGFHVLNQQAAETTSRANRFEIKLGAASTQAFPVIEERVDEETNLVSSLTPGVLAQFMSNKRLSEPGRRELEQIADIKRQIEANRSDLDQTTNKITSIGQDEGRVRSNLESLNRVSGQQDLVQKYAGELAKLEQQIAQLRDRQGELNAKNAQLQATLDDRIDKMAF